LQSGIITFSCKLKVKSSLNLRKFTDMIKALKIALPSLLFMLSFGACQEAQNDNPPNVIIMLVDDAGYADFGFMGCEDLKTPNIDRLAERGMVFTDAHVSASVCGPSRAGLITGKYQQAFGFECNPIPDFEGIDTTEILLSEAMKDAGYKTAIFGKWHLGDIPQAHPQNQGFDYSWSFISGGRSYFPHEIHDQKGHKNSIRENGKHTTFEGYLTDALSEKAATFIEKNKENPFFMYWAPNAVHTPMEATHEDLDLFKDHPRQTLAAMTWALDRSVGRIIESLKSAGVYENTCIFFLSDNGGATNNQSSNLPLKGFKGNKFEGGHRVPFFIHWPEQIVKGSTFESLTSALDIYPSSLDLAGSWSSMERKDIDGVSLLPFIKGDKGIPHEKLFWRKDKMAGMRDGKHKLLRVEELGYRLYDLENDLGETKDLQKESEQKLQSMKKGLETWEGQLESPKWIEPKDWNKVTWLIHEDLYNNQKVRVKNPGQLKKLKSEQ